MRKPSIFKLLRQLQAIDAGLRALENAQTIIPSPKEMYALEELKNLLHALPTSAETCEKACWKRIRAWRYVPYRIDHIPYPAIQEFSTPSSV